ncbi:NFX1-type zinc finger-containing protein 1 [Syngnathoides biaculeatus]|uniref:NFX1-type zinc finger-containing protein 1 n=1 Tax=Syngnathoides biaculeatus TaxID=300417 RepID=UPI002ADE68A7|nr:NFX1-type zinc finger-containing protein 1 [Syngnathoides biaculeatus]
MLRRGRIDGMYKNAGMGQQSGGGRGSGNGGTVYRSNRVGMMRLGRQEVVDKEEGGSRALKYQEMDGGGGDLEKNPNNLRVRENGGGAAGGSARQVGGERQRYRTASNRRRDGAGENQSCNRAASASANRNATPQGPRGTGGRGQQEDRERQGRRTWDGGRREGGGDNGSQKQGSSARRDGVPQGPRLGYKSLLELSDKEPSAVAFTLSSHPALPGMLLETEMRQDLVELLCLVLSKAFKSRSNRVTLQRLASLLKDSGFFRTILPHYLAAMRSECRLDRRKQYPLHLENILLILTQVLTNFPASSVQPVSLLLTLLRASMDELRTAEVDVPADVVEKVGRLEGLVKHLQEKSREGTLHKSRDTYGLLPFGLSDEEDERPVFRTMPIYPTSEEFIQDHRPFLRPNITSQRYTNTLIYLDTHFRLMREDLVRRLREGIQQLRQMQLQANNTDLKKKHFDDILVYFDVKLGAPKYMLTGLAYVVQFDVEPLKFVRWENSKRLLYGSLVCLSCDNFESFLYATVADRNPKNLIKGQVTVTFMGDSRFKLARMENAQDQVFLMVETPAYFEAYRYVLEGLQEQDENVLPFQRYIVECSKDVLPPAYLQRSDVYNLSSIAAPNYKGHIRPFHSLNKNAWPDKKLLSLDESQMSALQLALTKELTIIQGPPGTGKTHVGLKIAQALLDNENVWQDPGGKAQMLVVCYTNHALDQFLEGIYKFMPRGIVRVGGRSNSELLKPFNLRELATSLTFKQRQQSYLRHAFTEIHSELRGLENRLKEHSHRVQCSRTGILQDAVLEKFMMEKHWSSLHQPIDLGIWIGKSNLMTEWLGLFPGAILQMETEDGNMDEDELMTEPEQEELIDITEEAELIQADRIIEDNIDAGRGKDPKMERLREAMALKRVQKSMLAMSMEEDDKKPEQTEEEWTLQRDQKRKMKRKILRELSDQTAMSEAEESTILDIWALSMADRWRLYRLWIVRYRAALRNETVIYEEEYQQAADRYAEIKRDETLTILRMAKVIGMTTTGAAKFRKVLQELYPRVVIVEEAAEVLEAHIITVLSEACQHLILIGDHQQLRPSSTEYDLEKNYKMGVSMFERLVNMGLPFVRLNQQHRMRPEIARLLTPHIYKELENHDSVLNFDNIKGLKTNLFFVEHNQLEKQFKEEGKSHQNLHEATFVVALCRYLLLQEYKPEQITILTTYTAQFQCLRRLMPASQFSGVRVHVVDKYQGEENDIVLLSLVRSNLQGKIGFLSISNRVCVALSRAKKGLYCIGNSDMLRQVKLWSDIFSTLKEKDQVGGSLTLCCQNHPERQVRASCADDFNQAPEGGCTQPCEYRLDCGHVCTSVCHPYDQEHKNYKCVKDCTKIICSLGHKCPLVCHAKCPKICPVNVEKIIPKCQHKQMVPCHQDPDTFLCKTLCQKTLQCGDPCDSLCGLPCTSRCKANVMLKLRCGHSQMGSCFYQTQEDEPLCKTPCKQQLKCGHACGGTCSQCYNGRFHLPCSRKCDRLLICSHKCAGPCTRDCPPCQKQCENCCVHSKCMKTCGQPCTPCNEPCACQCAHQSCTKLCHEPCDRPPCTQPCAQTLVCGHPCIGLCGDKCPNKCRICHKDEVTEIFFGMEDEPEARFIQLEDCGHIIEHVSMDTYMAMDDEKKGNEEGQVAIKLKECPKCRTPIRKNLRYGSHINRSLAAIEMVKKKINGDEVDMKNRSQVLETPLLSLRNQGLLEEDQYLHIHRILTSDCITANDIWVLENKLNFLTKIQKLLTFVRDQTNAEVDEFRKTTDIFLLWVNNSNQKFTEQQIFDLQREVQRLVLWAEFITLYSTAVKQGKSNYIETEKQIVDEALGKHGQFTELDERGANEAMKVMKQKVPVTGLRISDEERKMIVSAMNMRSGHWYQCPNGHIYVITECGGAMEARRCTECDATIGGSNHRLASGNTVASVMDGARHAAWSEANNLMNFQDLYLD